MRNKYQVGQKVRYKEWTFKVVEVKISNFKDVDYFLESKGYWAIGVPEDKLEAIEEG